MSIFKMAAVRGFYEFESFSADRCSVQCAPPCQVSRPTGQPMAEIRRFFDVQNGGYPSSWIIKYSKF